MNHSSCVTNNTTLSSTSSEKVICATGWEAMVKRIERKWYACRDILSHKCNVLQIIVHELQQKLADYSALALFILYCTLPNS